MKREPRREEEWVLRLGSPTGGGARRERSAMTMMIRHAGSASKPYTRSFPGETLPPTPQPQTLNPTHQTNNPKLRPLNPKP